MERNLGFDKALATWVRPQSHAVAAKFFKNDPFPATIRRPTALFGHPVALCQGVAMTRRYGWTLAFFKEDHACPSGIVALGHLAAPDYVREGNISVGLYAKDMPAAARCEEIVMKLPVDSVDAVVLAPLHKADFEPDVVLIYGMPGQIVRLVQAANYRHGGAIESRFGGRFACAAEFVTPYLTGNCNVVLPGGGEKIFAMTENSEMAFALPGSRMEEIAEGLEATHDSGIQRFPFPVAGVKLQPQFPPSYGPFEEYCGLPRTS